MVGQRVLTNSFDPNIFFYKLAQHFYCQHILKSLLYFSKYTL